MLLAGHLFAVDLDRVFALKFTLEQFLADRILDEVFEGPAERTGAEIGIGALLDEELLGFFGEFELETSFAEPLADLFQLDVDHLLEVVDREVVEHDDVVETVEELRSEDLLDPFVDPHLHAVVAGVGVGRLEAEGRFVLDRLGTGIGRHDEDRVAEIDVPAEGIGEPPLFHHLQEHVEDVGMGLFDLVEQHHGVGTPPDLLRELAPLLEADVTRRSADQAAHVVLLHVFAHVDLDERIGVAKHEFGQGLRQERLAHARRPGKHERPDRPLRILEAGAAAADGLRDALDRRVLSDHSLVKLVFHAHQAGLIFGAHPRERDAGHLRDDLRHHLLVDDAISLAALVAPVAGHGLLLLLELVGLITEGRSLLEVLVGDSLFLLLVEAINFLVDFLEIRRLGHRLEPHAGACLVDHVDRLVGEAATGDVAAGELHGRLEGGIGDAHTMVALVAVAETLQDLHRLGLARRLHHDDLEAAIESRILLDIFAIFIERGGPDALDLAAGQRRLEHVGGVDRAFGTAGPHERVQLVDEEDGVFGAADLVHDRLDPLLELATVFRAGDHHRQIEHDDPPVGQQFRHVPVDHPLGKALHDRRFADAGLAEEHGIVFGAAAEDLDRPLDFFFTADHGVELALPGQFGEVAAEAVEGGRLAFAALRCRLAAAPAGAGRLAAPHAGSLASFFHAMAEQVEHLLADVFELEAEVHQHLRGHPLLLAEQAEEDVLGADIIMVEVAGLLHRVFDHLLGPRGLRQLAHRHHVGAALHELLDFHADLPQVDVEVFEHVGSHTAALLDEAEEHVLGADVLVVKPLGFLIGQLHHLASPVCKTLVHDEISWCVRAGHAIPAGFPSLDLSCANRTPKASTDSTEGGRKSLFLFAVTAISGDSDRPSLCGQAAFSVDASAEPPEAIGITASRDCGSDCSSRPECSSKTSSRAMAACQAAPESLRESCSRARLASVVRPTRRSRVASSSWASPSVGASASTALSLVSAVSQSWAR